MPELNDAASPLYHRSYFFDAGLRFACQRCGRCCTGSPGRVFLPEDHLAPLARHLGLTPADLVDRHLKRDDGGYRVREDADGRCHFYHSGGCRIYRQRPPQCASFPFWFQNLRRQENWQALKRRCPGVGRGSLFSKSRILAMMDGSPPLGGFDTLCHFTS